VLIEKQSMLTGVRRIVDMPITAEQFNNWQGGMLIQDAMPNLTDAQREFIVSGITTQEWEEAFGE
jgi:hypothetical protein|tara:strand:+ start:252 stop:446 length:195 start_codon:yes stop_codon:yes gene_type:complete